MKRFLIGFFAVVGVIVVGISLILIGLAMSHHDHQAGLPHKMVLTVSLDQDVPETAPKSSVLDAFGEPDLTLFQMIQTLDRARQDSRVVGLAAHLGSNSIGLASMEELRNALQRFERSGKFAYVYIDDLGDSPAMNEYWLASGFDQIWLHPIGELALTGFSAEMPFGRDALDKIGVEPEMLHQGKYKSFPEMVMRNAISDENREMTASMLGSLSGEFYKDVNATRHISTTQMDRFINETLISSDEALRDGLIDSIGYRDEFDSYIEQTTKGTEAVKLEDYADNGERATPGDKMALVNIHGTLTNMDEDQAFSGDIVSAAQISHTIRDATDDDSIKAIIVRVDSPGGTPLAADMIHRAIQVAAARKPVVVSMSNAAASGGYWMSTSANAIIAQPATLTGSIGVFGGKFNAAKLFDKVGVHWDTVTANATDNSDMWSVSRPYTTASSKKVEAMMEHVYQQFIRRVAEGRKMSPEQVEKIAQGRVWTGEQAIKIGLVDKLGGLDIAVATAKTMTKIPEATNVNLEIFPKPLSPVEQLIKFMHQGGGMPFLNSWMQMNFKAFFTTMLQSFSLPIIKA